MAPDLKVLRAVSKENLKNALRVLRGKKYLVIDSKLTTTLDLIANFQFLKDHGVEKVLYLEKSGPPTPSESVATCLYFIRSDLILAKLVCDHIQQNISRGVNMQYAVVVIPRLLHVIPALFEREGVHGHVTFAQYSYELLPLDEHILTLQYEDMAANLWLHQDTSGLASVAKAIFNARGIYGDFHHLIAMGSFSNTVVRMMTEYERIYSHSLLEHNRRDSDLPTVLIIDRSMDFVSPLMSSLSYEGMLDEVFGIKGKTITFGPEVTGKETTTQLMATSSDLIFEKIRNLHFSRVIRYLQNQAKDLKVWKDRSSGLSVQEMRNFVENELNQMKMLQRSLSLHLDAVGVIINQKSTELRKQVDLEGKILENAFHTETKNFLEDAMAKGYDQQSIMKLLCLIALTQDGVRDFKSIKTQFIHSYGFKHAITLQNLEAMGLLYAYKGIEANAKGVAEVMSRVANATPFSPSATKEYKRATQPSSFQNIVKKLVPATNIDVSIDAPNHASYVFNGAYTPFVAKITDEILSILKTPKINSAIIEKKLEDLMKFYQISDNVIKCKSGSGEPYGRGRNVLVFVVGGITRSEIVALQLVSKQHGFNIISGGTDITTGKKIVNLAVTV
ncbi:unnamed protein product [Allacma fusca]|uniref:Uncharacterized protein n=1 Tax=Allacma fusca TaxID=39272 RepID=A0A8J2JDZ4_9HEXA|nr:unnamed protein product [Allacma fusca]